MADWQPAAYKDYCYIVADAELLSGKLAIRDTDSFHVAVFRAQQQHPLILNKARHLAALNPFPRVISSVSLK